MRDSLSMGSADVALEDKTLTVCYGTDLVNLNFINFAANSREVAKVSEPNMKSLVVTITLLRYRNGAMPFSSLQLIYWPVTLHQ